MKTLVVRDLDAGPEPVFVPSRKLLLVPYIGAEREYLKRFQELEPERPGLDCLVCAIFALQRLREGTHLEASSKPVVDSARHLILALHSTTVTTPSHDSQVTTPNLEVSHIYEDNALHHK